MIIVELERDIFNCTPNPGVQELADLILKNADLIITRNSNIDIKTKNKKINIEKNFTTNNKIVKVFVNDNNQITDIFIE